MKLADERTLTPTFTGSGWELRNGDCIEELGTVKADSIDLSVYSPPFMSLYTYTASEHDMGNCATDEEFFAHFAFLQRELLRVTKPGRLTCCHVAQVPAMLGRDGYIGMKDFRGQTIASFIESGWIYHGEVCIDKDPQAQAIRTKSKGLLFVQMKKDSSWSRPALADYILIFRKPGENAVPVTHDAPESELTNDQWIQWARPIWYGIRESDTLQVAEARDDKDERHICPLQLGTIERCIRLWSNPGELVLSPFAGIGSEGYEAVRLGRRFLGFELKPQYANVAAKNLATAELNKSQGLLFDAAE
jgi:DNA modification methylase